MRQRWVFVLALISAGLLLAGMVFRFTAFPNQLLLTLPGVVLLHLVVLPAVLIASLRRAPTSFQRAVHLSALLVSIGFALVILVNLWGGGDAPRYYLVIWGVLVLCYLFGLIQASLGATSAICDLRCAVLSLIGVVLVLGNLPLPIRTADRSFKPDIPQPAYPRGKGPVVLVDEAHYNFHAASGRYRAFARVLENDGYRVEPYRSPFRMGQLRKGNILVIANALHPRNLNDWTAPPSPAFLDAEVRALRDWIMNGGSLLLAADPHPFAGAAAPLASALGFEFTGSFVDDLQGEPDVFTRQDRTLVESAVTNGREPGEKVESVQTFLGQAVQIPGEAIPVLLLDSRHRLWQTRDALARYKESESASAAGLCQLAFRRFGDGRVAVAGEAAMFSAQLDRGLSWRPVGMNVPTAKHNQQLLLNLVHWLDGRLD